MERMILAFFFLLTVASELPAPYVPRGWRPHGQSFNPRKNQLESYGPPVASLTYGSSEPTTRYPQFATTTITTAKPPLTAATAAATPTSTTPRIRKPTTASSNFPEEDIENNPALAIANSFAFNRPVYIYNAFPFPGFTVI